MSRNPPSALFYSRALNIVICVSLLANCALLYHRKSTQDTNAPKSVLKIGMEKTDSVPARVVGKQTLTTPQEPQPLSPDEISYSKNDITSILADTGLVLPLSNTMAKTFGVVPADIPVVNQALISAISSIEQIEKKIAKLESDEKGPFFHIPEFGNEMDRIIREFRTQCRAKVSTESWPAVEILTCAPHFYSGYSDIKVSAFVDGETVGISYTQGATLKETTSALSLFLGNRYKHLFDFDKIKSVEAAKSAAPASNSQ